MDLKCSVFDDDWWSVRSNCLVCEFFRLPVVVGYLQHAPNVVPGPIFLPFLAARAFCNRAMIAPIMETTPHGATIAPTLKTSPGMFCRALFMQEQTCDGLSQAA